MAPITKVVYVSSATRLLGTEELRSILSASRRNNGPLDVTGMLLYHDGNFMQVLEGPEEHVQHLLDRISGDTRHTGIIELLRWTDEERSFSDWRMAFVNLDELEPEELEGVSPFLEDSLADEAFRESPERAHKLLLSFKKNVR